LAARNENLPHAPKTPVSGTKKGKSKVTVNGSVSRRTSRDVKETSFTPSHISGKESTSVRDRVRDWERERERLREMARLEEIERERDEELERQKKQEKVKKQRKISIKEPEANKENHHGTTAFNNVVLPSPAITPPLTQGKQPVALVSLLCTPTSFTHFASDSTVTNKMSATETPSGPTSVQGRKIGHAIRSSIGEPLNSAFPFETNKCD
jgi:hypothetical protein